jgi:Fic family protein
LETADRSGESTAFIEFSLDMVRQAFNDLIGAIRPRRTTPQGRLEGARAHFQDAQFSRKDYLNLHKGISTATASRDLKSGVAAGILTKQGLQGLTVYRFLNPPSLRAI